MEQNSQAGFSARIRSRLPGLRDAEARVAQVLLDRGGELVRLSVSDVAELAGTAASTVVRTCQRLGFRGFQEVKILAAGSVFGPSSGGGEGDADPLSRSVRAARETLEGLAGTVSQAQLDEAAAALGSASRVLVTGAGLSAAVALDAAYRLRALGLAVDAPADPLTAQLSAGLLPATGVCLAISHTGATRTTVDAARRAREAGAEVIALTSYARTPLTELATRTLLAGGQDLVLGLEAVAGRLAHLAVVDALALTLLEDGGAAARRALSLAAEVTADHAY
ncbi:MurR/RpiR family transcriptional regulator [Phaeacidiphilus oryzae]|uniref:MurR/RpiR family transcriptional regulator n=1 Tax=Phaeacidiphilus oryzae TaxID=348818 RepID=UPI000567A44B|nr:MurR/RpiR family transcriptional regulator [Phaeacidiphilus oryzae]